MNNYKALFLDIDGTIITKDDQIEDSTIKAIQQVQEQGIEVFLATGRPIHEIDYLAKQLNIQSFIGYNGALAIYQGEEIVKDPLSSSMVEVFVTTAKKLGNEMLLFTNNKNLFFTLESPITKELIKVLHFKNNAALTASEYSNILSMSIINVDDKHLSNYPSSDFIRYSPVHADGLRNDYDVIRNDVNKGIAVAKVLDYLGIPSTAAIAFGDGMNDKEMLSVVGEGFAMGNAHSQLFEHAKHKTTSVDNSGIYNGLKTLGLIK